jgi:hypothetical protein
MARSPLSTILNLAIAGIAGLTIAPRLHADPPATTQPSILQQLSSDTQRLYTQSRHSIVRVQLPTPQWLEQFNKRQELERKWGQVVDPKVLEKALEQQDSTVGQLRPSTSPAASQPTSGEYRVSPPHQPAQAPLQLFAVGMLVDDEGHAMFPVFVEKKDLGDAPLLAFTADGEATTATFIGSDAQTNVTVLQLATRTGTPAPLGHSKPDDGELTLSIATEGGAKLVVWNSQHPEPGFAILPDGSVAGFGFGGHFLGASTAKPIVDQLIATGEVHRAVLGVLTVEVSKEDPLRRQRTELGTSPAIRILKVQQDSAAARGGVQPDDLVLTIGGDIVGDTPTFAAVIATRRGETVLRVLRGSKVVELTVNLQPKP